MAGFRVQLDALRQAADGVDGVLRDVAGVPLDELDAGPDVLGHAGLADGVATFLARWRIGVDALAGDARTVASRLRASMLAYERSDAEVGGGFVAGAGPDPGPGR